MTYNGISGSMLWHNYDLKVCINLYLYCIYKTATWPDKGQVKSLVHLSVI